MARGKTPPPPPRTSSSASSTSTSRRRCAPRSSSTATRSSTPGPCRTRATASSRCSADPLRDGRARAAARPRARQVHPRHRRGHGPLPPARRHGDLRRPRPSRAALHDAAAARRRARQLRLARRRPGRGPLHREPAGLRRHAHGRQPRRERRRLRPDVRRLGPPARGPPRCLPQPARQRRQRHRRRHGDEHGAAQPRRGHRRGPPSHRPPGLLARRPHEVRPRPDLPGGGKIVGLEGIRDAYLTGRGGFRTRATARIESVTPRRKGIVVTELPYLVGPEKVIEKIKDQVNAKRLQGIADVKDLSDRKPRAPAGHRGEERLPPRGRPRGALPADADGGLLQHQRRRARRGQPRTLGLKELLKVYVDFRTDVVRRRTQHRLDKALDRLHLVEGLLLAILDIDEVIQLIRGRTTRASPAPASWRSSTCPSGRPTTSSSSSCGA